MCSLIIKNYCCFCCGDLGSLFSFVKNCFLYIISCICFPELILPIRTFETFGIVIRQHYMI